MKSLAHTHNSPAAKAVAVIIGRAGSKGLPGKNALRLPFTNRPSVCYSIEHAQEASTVHRILVSTDGHQIAAAASEMDIEVVRRPSELASDTATVDSAVRHAINEIEESDPIAVVVILYANVPVRPAGLIDRAVHKLLETGADSVQSYCNVGKYHPYWMAKLDEDGVVSPNISNTVFRRQDLPPLYIPDGGVIAVTRKSLFTVNPSEPHAFLGKDRRGILTSPGEVVDIDSMIDAQVAGAILSQTQTTREVPIAIG
jgi:CMP-N,N'-diacetyllegionaminic acid synthase